MLLCFSIRPKNDFRIKKSRKKPSNFFKNSTTDRSKLHFWFNFCSRFFTFVNSYQSILLYMKRYFSRKIIIPVVAATFLFVGVSFKNDFFEIAKQIEIFTGLFKTVNQNYVDETNPGEMMDNAIKNMLKELDPYTVFFNEQDVLKFKINKKNLSPC